MTQQIKFTMYHREGCHLCEQMAASLYEQQEKHKANLDLIIEQLVIDEDPELLKKYHVDVPVLKHNDEVVCYHFFDQKAFDEVVTVALSEQID